MTSAKQAIVLSLALVSTVVAVRLFAAETKPSSGYEYVTIRWAGRDNTHVIRPGGQVEFIGNELRKMPRPDRIDERAFYMNLAMNGLTKEGFEFAGMSSDEIIMKRSYAR